MLQIEYSRGDPGTERLIKSLEELQPSISAEFIEWQAADMRRSYPNIDAGQTMWGEDASSWVTHIWPRSRDPKWRRGRPRRRAVAASRVVRKGVVTAGSMRPILRPELFEMLRDRMVALLNKVWQ